MMLTTSNVFGQAHFENIDGLRYLIDENVKSATLVANSDGEYSGDVVVPEKVKAKDEKEYPVTAFGDDSFKECRQLKSITIPSSVTSLGDHCFYFCTKLTSITIPSSVTSLGEWCFSSCSSLTSITIPSSVTSLGYSCFSGCSSLTNITLPSSVTSLGMYCFSYCRSLTSITLPSSVTSLGSFCFRDCSSLTSITIPSSVTSLEEYCFLNCSSLTNITIPSSVTSLGWSCFDDCSNLASITIPSSVTFLGSGCFSDCSKLESIYFKGECPSNITNSRIPTTCIIYVPKHYLQAYKDALGSTYPYIYEWKKSDGGDDKPTTKCETPTITYADGSLQFSSSTAGAEYHYTITDADMANDKLSQDGKVALVAAYKISAYATADGYQASDKATATLYWINANLETDPSTNINQAKTRGIIATSDGGIVTLSGLDNGEVVSFYSPDGRQLGAAKAENGIASCAVMESGVVIAKVGKNAIKIAVRK